MKDEFTDGIYDEIGEHAAVTRPDWLSLSERMSDIGDFGVGRLNIDEAAELIAQDMWASGLLPDIKEPENNQALRENLKQVIETLTKRLVAEVHCGQLKANVQMNFWDGMPDPELTYIKYDDLFDWLKLHGYELGDIFDEWIHAEADIASDLAERAVTLRRAKKTGRLQEVLLCDDLKELKNIIAENYSLKKRLADAEAGRPANVDRPLLTRQRRTLLVIIAALCKYAGIDPQKRGTAQRIAEMTDGIGASVDDSTIAKLLAEIPDALETRMK